MMRAFLVPSVALMAALGGCREVRGGAPAEDTSYRTRPGYVIDSVKPPEIELAEFRARVGPAPTRFHDGATTFDGLMSAFARAVEGNDSLALQRMQLDAAEFAWLVYPSSPYTRPPYRQSPDLAWLQLRAGDTGLRRLLARRGGAQLRIAGHHCDPEPVVEGDNRLWRHCVVNTLRQSGDTVRERLFGVVIERHGHFKFASYQNQY